jgi:sugar phosphate isomerase/epimerase
MGAQSPATVRTRLSISSISMPDAPFETEIERLARHGVPAVGLWESKIAGREIAEVKAHLDAHGVRVSNCVPMGNTIYPGRSYPEPADPRDRIELLRRRIARLAPLEPACVVTVSGPMRDEPPERFWETCRWAYGVLAETARDEGVAVALEPVRPSTTADDCPIPSIADAIALLESAGASGVGILVDSWHVVPDPQMREQIVRHRARIVGAHIADQRPGATSDRDRALPGEGTGESLALVQVLDEIGFDGYLDAEIISDDGRLVAPVEPPCLWQLDPDELIERCARFADGLARV